VYPEWVTVMRRGFYQVISGHTGTGFQNIYAPQFVTEWGSLALYGVIIAMGLGVSACSTTGGVKMLRIGLIFKAFREDIKRFLASESTVLATRFRHMRDVFLDDKMVRSAALITIAYILLYLIGAVAASAFGVPFAQALFESTSAAGNVGLSCGVTQAAMPAALKVVFVIQMWAGRLEFISVFVLIGFVVSYIRGK
jgi:trk system potassium uptake protein